MIEFKDYDEALLWRTVVCNVAGSTDIAHSTKMAELADISVLMYRARIESLARAQQIQIKAKRNDDE